jgi:predicted transcriptional regulator
MGYYSKGGISMISVQSQQLLETNIADLMIPAERVAHVQIGNHLEHAMLVLTKTGYTAIPVLDVHYKLHGLISSPLIMDAILGIERIEFEKLSEKKVEEAMNKNIPRLRLNDSMKKVMSLLVDYPFLCVVNEEEVLEGIITRRELLKQLNSHIHQWNHFHS